MNTTTVSPATRKFVNPIILSLCLAVLLGGCATTKDARSRDNISNLKTTHLAFIDEFTEGAGKTWDDQKLATRIAAMETQFSQAEQYAATNGNDKLRSNALANIHSQFKRDAAALQRRKAFYRAKFAAHLRDQVSQNYDQALRGEDVRS